MVNIFPEYFATHFVTAGESYLSGKQDKTSNGTWENTQATSIQSQTQATP